MAVRAGFLKDRGMRILVFGGTVFLGRAVAAHAASAGHLVTCAARGRSGPVPDGVELVVLDRDDPAALAALAGRDFDAVIDVGSRPSQVRSALAGLAGRVGHWGYVSTGSVYADDQAPDQNASAPTVEPAPSHVDDPRSDGLEYYGPLKVSCEQAVRAAGVPAFVCRAGLIVGPGDTSDRFTYWPVRLARGGPVLAPGQPTDLVQFVDVRDLAGWLVYAAQHGVTGVYDGVGAPMPRAEFLAQVALGVGTPDPDLVWVGQDVLERLEVAPWAGKRSLPLWLPLPRYGGFMTRDARASLAAGLGTRPLADTAADTLAWYTAAGSPALSCGLTGPEEVAVLTAAGPSQPGTPVD